FGVRIVGGCCGTTPAHLKEIVSAVSGANGNRDTSAVPGTLRGSKVPRAASALRGTGLAQNPKPLLIGEPVNAQGPRQVNSLLLADDYEGISDVAREQVESGAHVLDVCVAVTERADEVEQMQKVVKLLSMTVETPIMIDSTEPAVIQRALETIPGR